MYVEIPPVLPSLASAVAYFSPRRGADPRHPPRAVRVPGRISVARRVLGGDRALEIEALEAAHELLSLRLGLCFF